MTTQRKLAFGVYEATPNFRSIEQHSCVCYADDLGLVATTGPAEDRESQEFAELFAAAPELLEACKVAYDMLEFKQQLEGLIPVEKNAFDLLIAAIAKAEGN